MAETQKLVKLPKLIVAPKQTAPVAQANATAPQQTNNNSGRNKYTNLNFVTPEPKKSNAQDAAFKLQRANNGLFDRSIMDLGKFECNFRNNNKWLVDVRKDTNNDGKLSDEEFEQMTLLNAIVDSHDSVLDLYINQKLEDIIKTYGPSCTYNLRAMFGDPNSEALKELARLGIRADAVGCHEHWQNRTYTFSLVDMSGYNPEDDKDEKELMKYVYSDNAEIIQDEKGKRASIIFADCLTADGTAQGAEVNLASILDQMGYECVSKSDFINDPDAYNKLIKDLEADIQSGYFESSGETINDKYGATLTMAQAVCAVYDINGDAPGHWGEGASYDSIKAQVDAMGNSLYKGGGARKGKAQDFGILQTLSTSSEGVAGITQLHKLDANGNPISELTIKNKEPKKIKNKDVKADQQAKEQKQTKADKEAQALQAEIEKATEEALEIYEEQMEKAEKNGEEFDKKRTLKEIAKKYDLDYYELCKEI